MWYKLKQGSFLTLDLETKACRTPFQKHLHSFIHHKSQTIYGEKRVQTMKNNGLSKSFNSELNSGEILIEHEQFFYIVNRKHFEFREIKIFKGFDAVCAVLKQQFIVRNLYRKQLQLPDFSQLTLWLLMAINCKQVSAVELPPELVQIKRHLAFLTK